MEIKNYFSAAEFKAFSQSSDVWASWLVIFNWATIFGALTVTFYWPNILTVLLAIFVIGGRQLGFGVLMHEAGHKTLFKTQGLNQFVGQWLCAYPLLAELNTYATTHREHHRLAGSQSDPDLPNYVAYPVETASLKRKMIRDLSGQTGIRNLGYTFSGQGDITTNGARDRTHLVNGLLVNAVLFFLIALLLTPWLYLIWVVSYLTTFAWCSRIRQIAEHGAVADLMSADPRLHTRTTLGNLFERIVLCPNFVNYHCEHHLAPTVPCYRLRAFHKALVNRGFYEGYESSIASGYTSVLRSALRLENPVS